MQSGIDPLELAALGDTDLLGHLGSPDTSLFLEVMGAKPVLSSLLLFSNWQNGFLGQAYWRARGDTGQKPNSGAPPQQQVSHNVLDLGRSQVADEWPFPV
ncbi:hypothetical protein PG993_003361 [Apiospora rasikravindrae]|uniref:Uncharacterized protein n=1 Tax=Apiospora rasikravindrae TaxID=990691 RepID=A0ABR1TZA5_9PEZI